MKTQTNMNCPTDLTFRLPSYFCYIGYEGDGGYNPLRYTM